MRTPVVAAALALCTGVCALGLWSYRLPDLEVRSAPRRIAFGHVREGTRTGEVFSAERDGLERVDVAVTAFTEQPPSQIELVLRADGPEGVELRRVRAARLEPAEQGGWLTFEFEPVTDSAGRRFHAEFGPAPGVEACEYGPWIRFRGLNDRGEPWGQKIFSGPLVEGRFISDHAHLRGLAFGGERLGGTAELVLLDVEGRELRRARAENPAPVEWGWLVFGFEPLDESRWRTLGYRLELPDAAQLLGGADGPARVGFYGGGRVHEALGGLTRGGERFDDRDLVLRTWSERGPIVAWGLLRARLSGRGVLTAALVLAASALLGATLGSRRGHATAEGAA